MAPPHVTWEAGIGNHAHHVQSPVERESRMGSGSAEAREWGSDTDEEEERVEGASGYGRSRRDTGTSTSTRAYEEEQLLDVAFESSESDGDIEKDEAGTMAARHGRKGRRREGAAPPHGTGTDPAHHGATKFSFRKLLAFTGPGLLVSIAYLDPGNLESDLQAGSQAGYQLLWILLWATMMGLFIQLLSARLGVVTKRHLAELCGETYPRAVNYVLWVMAEIAIIGSDIQEVMGTAIAVRILSGYRIPIWAGVLITAVDSFFLLFLENLGVRKLEAFFAACILVMMGSFVGIFVSVAPDPVAIAKGVLIPYVNASAAKQAVGIVGAVIMPHNIFLHSALVQSRKISHRTPARLKEVLQYYSIESTGALSISFLINLAVTCIFARVFSGREDAASVGLVNAGEKLAQEFPSMGSSFLLIWAIGLLSAGQSSTMTGTYAGQFVMAGFLDLPISRLKRALLTRAVAIGPTLAVAVWCHSSPGDLDVISAWLNVLQAFQLPFAIVPLLKLSSCKRLMGEFRLRSSLQVLAWVISVVIVSTNGYLLVVFISDKLGSYSIAGYAGLFTFAAVYLLFMVILGSGPDNAHRVVNRTCSTVARMRGWSKCLRIDGAGDGATRDDLQDLQEGLLKRDGCDSNHVVIPQKERRQEAALGAGA